MVRRSSRNVRRSRFGAIAVALTVLAGTTLVFTGSSSAQVPEVSGDAFGYYTSVSLFGGPPGPTGPDPIVTLPAKGSDGPITATAPSGVAKYGPATIFGGQWPIGIEVAPASGPLAVSIEGKPGPGGSVTAKSGIYLHPTPAPATCSGEQPGSMNCKSPGGFGPVVPNTGDSLEATCSASEQGVTGSTKIVNGTVATSTDESGEPKDTEPIPENPPPNYTKTGQITNVHDNWKTVYNEQIIDPDGSITVNAIHMSLLGPIAIGDEILGHVRCSRSGLSTSPTSALAAPVKKVSTPAPPAADEAAATKPDSDSDSDAVPFVIAGAVVVAAVAILGFVLSRRRRVSKAEPVPE
ncbi:MAG TPA: hypothetical protein VF711_13425 [Acidimicrobiales bacterium]|jgi:hypothetical protein